jgi:hypothetical protein
VYTLAATSASPAAGGGASSVNVTCSDANCTPTVTSNDSWITNVSASGSGTTKTAYYTVAANVGPARTGTITIGGKTFTVNQADGCTYTLSPTGVNIAPNGGTGSVTVNRSNSSCPAPTASSNDSWITNVTVNGSGNVNYTVATNYGTGRNGTATIGGKTFTVTQKDGAVCSSQQQGCYDNVPMQCQSQCSYITEDPNCYYAMGACYSAFLYCYFDCESQENASCDAQCNYCMAN